jgi:hypothetical protein
VWKGTGESDAPTVGIDFVHMHSEQEKEEEVGTPIVVVRDLMGKDLVKDARKVEMGTLSRKTECTKM